MTATSNPQASRRRDHRVRQLVASAGFTLLELLVVAGILAVLMGIGLGFLSRGDAGEGQTWSTIAGALRGAALSARTTGLPTAVRIDPATDRGPASVRGRQLVPLTVMHLEPVDATFAPVLRPVVRGVDVPQGRFGHARRNRDGDKAPLVQLPVDVRDFDLRDGFAFRVDVKLDRREACTVLRLARSLELAFDGAGRPQARFVEKDVLGKSGSTALLGRWFSLELTHDGHELWCAIDGRVVARTPATSPLLQTRDDVLEISPGDSPVPGVLDEVQWFMYVWSEPALLPMGVDLAAGKAVTIAFDGNGEAIDPAPIELEYKKGQLNETLTVKRGGVLE
jgi:prepilin-type N-terminal cleavage/methylation domain-containing protein